MNLYSVNTGYFKLDGGAMFGVVPKSLWSKTNQPDENNLCTWAMRSLLIEDGNKLILVDTGIGNKQSEKFFSHYHLHGDDTLDQNLKQLGFHRDDITDILLTHLHFDHCGGAIERDPQSERFRPAFKNAKFWSNKDHWQWATQPNPREKASFLKENILPIEESGQLHWVDVPKNNDRQKNAFPEIDIFFANGHTDKQMIPIVHYKGKKVAFMADLLPSTGHIPLPYVMGYDTRPLLTMEEKEAFLNEAADQSYILFLEHDAINECCTVAHTEKGVRLADAGNLKEFVS